jgi:hypothetical protein
VASDSALFRAIRATRGEGAAEARGLDRIPRLYGFARLGPEGSERAAILALGVPLDIALAETRSLERKILLALTAMTLLALAAVWLGGGVRRGESRPSW